VWQKRDRLGDLPVGEWKEYITPNTYPAGIRPTLRDAVSYLQVEMLADTNGWQPDQLNEIYRLNLKNLINGTVGEVSPVDPTRHPLEKISLILADLENWHIQKKERESALEARLERYRQIHEHFKEAEDRNSIQSDLEMYLRPLADVAWWAEGMAQLAEFVRTENEPDSLIRARQIAIQGRTAFPESVGGKHCLSIEKQIEAPEYAIAGMRNDNPQNKSVLITHRNLSKMYFRAYPVDLLKTIETSNDYNLMPSGRELERLVANTEPAHQWEVPLPATPDYRMHKTFVVPPLRNFGTYLIVSSARRGFPK